ncbi:F-box protein CPR1-like [Mercurialis annua]|uniref:F-box protein CPR1-like n=1 Tax=Mercurialis annua TaxID=3986 RepID=UPI0024AD4023|nr:F-box protein CPR1-like [Mercurialis annua]
MGKPTGEMSSIHLPADISENILLRLPVESLLRFRCVSKSFCTLIDSSYFINAHIQFSIRTQTRNKLIIFHQERGLDISFYAVDLHTEGNERVVQLVSPVSLPSKSDNILDSANGLLLLSSSEQLMLWNPFTNRYRILPIIQPTPHEFDRRRSFHATDDRCRRYQKYHKLYGPIMYFTYKMGKRMYNNGVEFDKWRLGVDEFGLGFDVSSNDYKVVRIHHLTYDEMEVWVYSLKSNSWTRFDDVTFDVEARKSCSIFVQCFYQITKFPIILARFDFASNKFQLLPYRRGRDDVFVLEGQVCLELGYRSYNECKVHLLGVADEYDDPVQFWREVDTIQCESDSEFIKPLMFYPEAGFMADVTERNADRNIVWYDLKKKTLQNYEIPCVPRNWINSVTCWETLVQLY